MKEFCLLLRDMKLPIYRDSILDYINRLIEGTPQQELFKHKRVRKVKVWFYHDQLEQRQAEMLDEELRRLPAVQTASMGVIPDPGSHRGRRCALSDGRS